MFVVATETFQLLCALIILNHDREGLLMSRSPWQNAYFERIIGSTRRECMDHLIVSSRGHLRGVPSFEPKAKKAQGHAAIRCLSLSPTPQDRSYLLRYPELDPEVRTPRTGKSVVHGRPVRSLATNRKPAVGGQRGGVHCNGASVRFLPSARQRRSNCAGGTYPNDECLRSVL